eukprot:COSAG02_NODE_58432_length_277_cov_0.870787_1_plen_24_part_10
MPMYESDINTGKAKKTHSLPQGGP